MSRKVVEKSMEGGVFKFKDNVKQEKTAFVFEDALVDLPFNFVAHSIVANDAVLLNSAGLSVVNARFNGEDVAVFNVKFDNPPHNVFIKDAFITGVYIKASLFKMDDGHIHNAIVQTKKSKISNAVVHRTHFADGHHIFNNVIYANGGVFYVKEGEVKVKNDKRAFKYDGGIITKFPFFVHTADGEGIIVSFVNNSSAYELTNIFENASLNGIFVDGTFADDMRYPQVVVPVNVSWEDIAINHLTILQNAKEFSINDVSINRSVYKVEEGTSVIEDARIVEALLFTKQSTHQVITNASIANTHVVVGGNVEISDALFFRTTFKLLKNSSLSLVDSTLIGCKFEGFTQNVKHEDTEFINTPEP